MTLNKEAKENKPKRPPNIFFLFCSNRRAEKKEIDKETLNAEYSALSENAKDKLKKQCKDLKDKYNEDMAKWR